MWLFQGGHLAYLGVLLGGVLALRSGEVRTAARLRPRRDIPTVKVERAVEEADNITTLGPLKTATRGIATRTLPIPVVLVDDVKAHLRNHAQLGRNGLLFWRTQDGEPVKSADWLKAFKRACQSVASRMEIDAESRRQQTGDPESDEVAEHPRPPGRNGGYIFHRTRVTGLTWAHRLSAATCEPDRRSPATPPHDGSPLPTRRDRLLSLRRRQRLQDDRKGKEGMTRRQEH